MDEKRHQRPYGVRGGEKRKQENNETEGQN